MHSTHHAAGLAHAAMLARHMAERAPTLTAAQQLHAAAAVWLDGAYSADGTAAMTTADRVAAQLATPHADTGAPHAV